MRAIADAQSGGVVIHCHAGKDRTGIVSALLLDLADVPAETIAADYAESQARLWPLYEKIIAEAGGEDKVGFWLKPTATEEMMYMMLEHMDTKYSGVEPYLRASGLSSREIDQFKNRLCST
jgi:protein tyrosine/serine phosphatase